MMQGFYRLSPFGSCAQTALGMNSIFEGVRIVRAKRALASVLTLQLYTIRS